MVALGIAARRRHDDDRKRISPSEPSGRTRYSLPTEQLMYPTGMIPSSKSARYAHIDGTCGQPSPEDPASVLIPSFLMKIWDPIVAMTSWPAMNLWGMTAEAEEYPPLMKFATPITTPAGDPDTMSGRDWGMTAERPTFGYILVAKLAESKFQPNWELTAPESSGSCMTVSSDGSPVTWSSKSMSEVGGRTRWDWLSSSKPGQASSRFATVTSARRRCGRQLAPSTRIVIVSWSYIFRPTLLEKSNGFSL